MKAWESVYGSTYEEAAANPLAHVGKSGIFISDTTEPFGTEPSLNLVEGSYRDRPFQGFVIAVPEPSITVIGIGGMVAVGILGKFRKKKF